MPMTTFYNENQIRPPTDEEILGFYLALLNKPQFKNIYIHEVEYELPGRFFKRYEKRYHLLKHLFGNEYQILCSIGESLSKNEILAYLLGFINGIENNIENDK